MKAATGPYIQQAELCLIFQSTPPVKAATKTHFLFLRIHSISIHAAREGGDPIILFHFNVNNISIHAAREGGDWREVWQKECLQISIHAAREGGDATLSGVRLLPPYFNPRRP